MQLRVSSRYMREYIRSSPLRTSSNNIFQDFSQDVLRTPLRNPSLLLRTSSQDFSRDLLRGPLQDFLSRHLLISSLMSSFGDLLLRRSFRTTLKTPYRPLRTFSRKLSHDLLSGLLLSSSQDLLSRHLLRMSLKTSFEDLLSRPLPGMRLLTSSQDIFSGLVSRPPCKTSSRPPCALPGPLPQPHNAGTYSRDIPSRPLSGICFALQDIFSGPLSRLLVRTSSQNPFHDLLSGPHLSSSKDLLSRHLRRTPLKTSFEDLPSTSSHESSSDDSSAFRDHDPC